MSHSQLAVAGAGHTHDATEFQFVDGEGGRADALLAALDDERCREIIEATEAEPLSATEVAEVCEIPLSTTYRKLETLTEVGLLVEQTRISPTGSHPSEYRSVVDEVVLSIGGEDGMAIRVSRQSSDGTAPAPTSILPH